MQLTGQTGNSGSLFQSQDSNLSNSSLISNDGSGGPGSGGHVDHSASGAPVGGAGNQNKPDPSPEKMAHHPVTTARTPTERKRKRKKADIDGSGVDPNAVGSGGKGAKKINDYFKHQPSSPVRQPGHPNFGPHMYPQSPQQPPYVGSPSGPPPSFGQGNAPGTPVPDRGEYGPMRPMAVNPSSRPMASMATQTDLASKDVTALEERSTSELESKESRIEELTRINEELTRQLTAKSKELDEKSKTIEKCLSVAKDLLKEKSSIEKKEARAKSMQNRLRLGQFVTQRVGATFQENWTDGYAFQELAKRQEDINNEREEIERKKKQLAKRKPSEAGSTARKRSTHSASSANNAGNDSGNGSNSNSGVAVGQGLNNGSSDETLFTKPPPRDGMTLQEYYESEEILRLRLNSLKKEDADLQIEMEKLERSRNLHIRELKRIHNEDQSRYNNHPMLNDRYLLLMLLGKGGFSEVHKVTRS